MQNLLSKKINSMNTNILVNGVCLVMGFQSLSFFCLKLYHLWLLAIESLLVCDSHLAMV